MRIILCCLFLCASILPTCAQVETDASAEELYRQGRALTKEKQYTESREMFTKALSRSTGELHRRIVGMLPLTWYMESVDHLDRQRLEESLKCAEVARKGFHDIRDAKNELSVLKTIELIYSSQYDDTNAMNTLSEALPLALHIHDNASIIEILKKMREIGMSTGDVHTVAEASNLVDSIIASDGADKTRFEYYKFRGDDAMEEEQYGMAEVFYKQGLDLLQHDTGVFIGTTYTLYSRLQRLYEKWEKYDEALKFAQLGKDYFHNKYSKDSPDYYFPYTGMAHVYRLMHDSIRCFEAIDSLFVMEDKLTEPQEKTTLYITRAACHKAFRNYVAALHDYKKTDELLAVKYTVDDDARMSLLAIIGGLECELGNYEESERLYTLCADLAKQKHGDASPLYMQAVVNKANAEAFANHIELGCLDYMFAMDKMKEQIRRQFPYYSTTERTVMWRNMSEMFFLMTPFALEAQRTNDEFTSACYDALVMSKSFLLASERSVFDVIKKKGSKEDAKNYSTASSIRVRLKSLENNPHENADEIISLTAKADSLEHKYFASLQNHNETLSFVDIDYNAVKAALGEGETLIDFADFMPRTQNRTYAGFLIQNNQEYPLLKKLFTEADIDSLQVQYPDEYYMPEIAREIMRMVWKPFENLIQEGATVYYVPTQRLFQIALESLPLEDGTLLGEHYHLIRLSSARELKSYREELQITADNNGPNAVLYGGLNYSSTPEDMKAEAERYDIQPLFVTRGNVAQGNSNWPDLRGVKDEISRIESALRSQGFLVKTYTCLTGTEESFLSLNGHSPQILHVSTHGFYYTPEKAKDIDYLRGYSDAMMLSGLILSGANSAWTGKEVPAGVLGGVLTAENISRLDLSNTHLLVLSACQTGQGKATPEGLYGLQRAFKKAGVKTMVLTLWNISNVVATEFMTRFYAELTNKQNKWNKRKAFEKAKLFIKDKYRTDPRYWAGFVMLD